MVEITEIFPESIAAALSLEAGDRIVSVNGAMVRDFLDVLLAEKLQDVALIVEKTSGELWQLDIEKEADESFGVVLQHPEPEHCGNKCIFCFVHQLPKGMRRTLYVKDEDFRFSYLYGAYITLSNLSESDIDRIIEQQLSPLYVSVHAVDENIRSRMLGRTVPAVLPVLRRLVDNGIVIHAQIVVCPGVNDGEHLTESVEQLEMQYPGVRSLALVPVGLTAHRDRLEPLRLSSAVEAKAVIDQLHSWQSRFFAKHRSRFVFAADEYYLKAGYPIPDLADYEDLSQLENGVGMIALFRDEMEDVLAEAESLALPVEFSIVTGQAFAPEMGVFLDRLAESTGCHPNLYAIENHFFGRDVTVAGLLTGNDIAAQLKGRNLGSALLIPDVMMRAGDELFLDDMRPVDLAELIGCRVIVVPATAWAVLETIEDLVLS